MTNHMTEGNWNRLWALLDDAWPGSLDPDSTDAYRTLLDSTSPDEILVGVKRLLHAGARYRPTPAEIIAEARRDPTRPTFDETLQILFGQRTGVLDVRVRGTRDSNPNHAAELAAAVTDRLAGQHPVVSQFVARVGLQRLRSMNIDDPATGHWRREELHATWTDLIDAGEQRQVHVLAAGGDSSELRRLDPLASLPAPPTPRRALTESTESQEAA